MIKTKFLAIAVVCFILNAFTVKVYASENVEQYISRTTGWDIQSVVWVLDEDIRNDWGITEEEADTLLLGEMRPYGADFCNGSVKFQVFAGIAAFETGHFQYIHQNNVGGIIDINGNYKSYDTIEEGIADMDRLLSEEYLAEDGLWSVGDNFTILGIAEHYNTNIEWLAGYVDVRLSLQRRIERRNEQKGDRQ